MFKIKLLAGLAALVTTLVVAAAPAMAEFESTNGQTQGNIKTFPETTTFESVEGGVAITCKNEKGEPKGEWQIQTKATTQQGKFFYQAAAKKGPVEQLKIEKWGTCATLGVAGTVKCNLQVFTSSNGNTGGVYAPGCEVKFGTGANTCTVLVQPGGNKELSSVMLTSISGGIEISPSVKGVTSTTQETGGECKVLTVKGGQGTGDFKTKNPLVTEGQRLV